MRFADQGNILEKIIGDLVSPITQRFVSQGFVFQHAIPFDLPP